MNVDFSDPLVVANSVLRCFKEKDWDGLKFLFNDANQVVLNSGQSNKFYREFIRKFETTAKLFERVNSVSEFREYKRDENWDFLALFGKVKQDNHLTHVITLTRKNGEFRFDQLMAPRVWEFSVLKPFN